MTKAKSAMKMPELLVFARMLAIGFVGAEVWRISFYLGASFASKLADFNFCIISSAIFSGVMLSLIYGVNRGAHISAGRIIRSLRIDLLIAVCVGIWTNALISPSLSMLHVAIKKVDPYWGGAILLFLCVILLSPLIQQFWRKTKKTIPQLYFIADEEIDDVEEDLLSNEAQAKSFAETILASAAHAGLVFGVDGPWGVGKTSFINLAQRYWANAEDRAIVCRFEPLRYASEPDLTDRLIRDLSATIQRKVFVPEFRPTVSRYSRLIKGKADVSFLGFRLSMEPSNETIDELLEDIDEVLKRIDRRVIIIIDDLDRLDSKTINNVLFATRRTFKLSQATYVLCYDTEILVEGKDESSKAREFLEKFVTVKLSLFVDSSSIRDFLRRDWQREENKLGSIPSDTMLKLSAVLNELADILDGSLAAKYLPLVGNMRKVKRFVNAMVLMQIEKSDLGKTDFNKRDLINLMLIHLGYPGLFRQIYAEETEGRKGIFSVKREYDKPKFKNSIELSNLIGNQEESPAFLLSQLFDVTILGLEDRSDVDEAVLASRACFNQDSYRNLEKYLKLIVRFATPEPQETFVLYQKAVEKVKKSAPISTILTSSDFSLERGEQAHDQFWRLLVSQSYEFTRNVADDAIDTLINYLPRYSAIENEDRGLRQRSIYSLLMLVDRAGWGRTSGRRLPNSPENIIEIAWRIFGENTYKEKGIIERLAHKSRGVIGWNDLMIFRLYCSMDRQGQLHNLYSALIVHQDENAQTNGLVSDLSIKEMREISQEIFALFKLTYIDTKQNFFTEVRDTSDEMFLGEAGLVINQLISKDESIQKVNPIAQRISMARLIVKNFVIYQLSNSLPPSGSGVGCGYYDEFGANDAKGIANLMNDYVFDFCFNPNINEDNIFHFLDYCLSNLTSSFFSGAEESGYFATKSELPGGLDPNEMGKYWSQYSQLIRQQASDIDDREVLTSNYTAFYNEDLAGVFTVLDQLANEVAV